MRRLQLRHRQQPRTGRHGADGRRHPIRLVIAGSYSQTYLRNAINNGFLCVECPEFARALHAHHQGGADRRTIIDDEPVRLDVAGSAITWRGRAFRFLPLGTPVQRIVLAGGVENMVRAGTA